MEKLTIKGNHKSPTIKFDHLKGTLELIGRSIPENAIQFYEPLLNWLDQYAKKPFDTTNVIVKLEYFNTSSSKCILDIFKKLEEVHAKKGKDVKVSWYYEDDDDDMRETGVDFQELTGIPFEMKEVPELF